jgi:hypothetical protein
VAGRRGEYVDQSRIAVKTYLEEWLAGHAATVKPKTWIGYRNDLRLYVIPRIGSMRLQALRPATISKLYAELAKSGGKGGRPLAVPTVQHVHRSLRKALNDAVMIDAVMSSNPTLKAKLPRDGYREPRVVWSPEDLEVFLEEAAGHRLHAFFRLAAYTAVGEERSCTCVGLTLTWTQPRSGSRARPASWTASGSAARPRAAEAGWSASTRERCR